MAELGRQGDKLNVFISYSRDDLDFADQLDATLRLAGYETTLDRHGIRAGELWETRLGEMIRDADTVVFVLSPSSAASKVCAWEVEEATRLGKRIIPVVCRPLGGESPPPSLAALNYIFFYSEPRKSGTGFAPGLFDLAAALNTDLDWLREHTRLLQRATEWETGGRPSIRLLSGRDIEAAKAWAARQPKDAPAPTALHLEFFRASEEEEGRRQNAELQRLQQMAEAQAARGAALEAKEQAQKREAEAMKREAAQARRVVRRTLAGLAAALVLAATAGGLGYEAEQQRAKAQRALDQVTSNANARVVSLAERARQVTQNQESIAIIAEPVVLTARDNRTGAGDIEHISHLMELSAQLLDKEDAAPALKAAEAGMKLAETSAATQQADSRWQMMRSQLHQRLGLAAARLDRTERAARDLAASLKLAEELAAASPSSLDVRERLAVALQDMGDISVKSGSFDDAEQHYTKLLVMRSADVEAPGASEIARRQLAVAHNRMANLFFEQLKLDAAIEASRKAIVILDQLRATRATDPAARRELSTAYQLTADALRAAKKPTEALAWLEKDFAITKALAESDATNAIWQHDLATTYAKLGQLQKDLGRTDAALATIAKAVDVGEALNAHGRRRPEWLRDTAAALESRGTILTQIGRAKEAVPTFLRGLALREQVAASSMDVSWQRELEDAYRRTRNVLLKNNYPIEALETAEQQVFAISLAPDDTPGKNERVARALAQLCWTALFARSIPRAEWAGEYALALDPALDMAKLNYAHALMYAGKAADARRLYMSGLNASVEAAAKWRKSIRSDFSDLADRKLQHPMMAEIDREIGR
jgi:tetratricopeptide (TPR) repeat protein